jgi:hypothetical protein
MAQMNNLAASFSLKFLSDLINYTNICGSQTTIHKARKYTHIVIKEVKPLYGQKLTASWSSGQSSRLQNGDVLCFL